MLSLGKHDKHMCFLSANMTNMFSVGRHVQKYMFQLWCSAFGSPALVPGFGPTGPMAHWASMCCITFGILCVASVLGNYVLHRP